MGDYTTRESDSQQKFLRPDYQSPVHTKGTSTGSNSSYGDDKSSFYTYESRATTPDVDSDAIYFNEKLNGQVPPRNTNQEVDVVLGGAGRLPDEVYERTLPWWRAALRKKILGNVEWESEVLASMQKRVRTPFLDAYFVYTSSLGTHTFFMTSLPALFFFGYRDVGRGLLIVLAFGVYVSSFLKDLMCCPRPFAPPVTRLTIGNHHLEYGFPSTHSTNSVSIALYIFSMVYQSYTSDSGISATTFWASTLLLLFYVFSIVFGRLYTAMHSFTDCIVGVLLGTGIWALHFYMGDFVKAWLQSGSWAVPAVTIPLCLLLVNRHPQPVDDCPCFEDAIAFMSVVLGEFLTTWSLIKLRFDEDSFMRPMSGRPFGTWGEMSLWWSVAAAKMVLGILTIFVWRIFAKFLCHRILPPIFRFLSHLFTLPNRRFYTPATDYKSVPEDKDKNALLHPIPSVIDLPGMVELEVDDGVAIGASSGTAHGYGYGKSGTLLGERADVKLRGTKGARGEKGSNAIGRNGLGIEEMGGQNEMEIVKHYDADVLTKVVVYCGISIVATGVVPFAFELLGWGLRPS
ncbi:PAP2-domain-containing protein [Panus rudis PR-1116 ss-1]|nr:PAP2-domain-containing protein [Panus rudis PR-1116 ss-1]